VTVIVVGGAIALAIGRGQLTYLDYRKAEWLGARLWSAKARWQRPL